MTQYTILLKSEIQGIAGNFKLDVIDYELIEQGVANSNYLIDTNEGKYVVTVFEIKPKQIAYMSKILLLLKKYDFPAPRLKNMSNGEVLAKYQEKAVLVKSYIPGQTLKNLEEGQVQQVGAALATLHEIPAPNYLSSHHTYLKKPCPLVIEQEIDRGYKKWVEKKCREIAERIPSNLPVGLAHGDLFCDNVLFKDDKFKAILDFEKTCRMW